MTNQNKSEGMKQSKYKNPVCRGSYALGTACGTCERCEETKSLGKPKKDTGYKKIQRERDEYFTKWGEYMKRANVAEERIKQLEGLLGECEEMLDQAVRQWEMHASFHEEDYINEENIEAKLVKETYAFLNKLKAAKEGKV